MAENARHGFLRTSNKTAPPRNVINSSTVSVAMSKSSGIAVQLHLRCSCKSSTYRTQNHALQTYWGAEKSLARPTSQCILFDGQNISFDASLVIYKNSINIPPIMIINRIYETQIFCRCNLFLSWSG